MRKILSGMLGIVMTAAVVGGVAYAAFTTQATVEGISIASGDASLQVYDGFNYTPNWDTGLDLTGVFPGYTENTILQVKNMETSVVSLNVTAKLTSALSGWGGDLTYATLVDVQLDSDPGEHTGFKSLAAWNAGEVTLPGGALAPSEVRDYRVVVQIGPTYLDGPLIGNAVGNEILGESITGITFTLTGTQTP